MSFYKEHIFNFKNIPQFTRIEYSEPRAKKKNLCDSQQVES